MGLGFLCVKTGAAGFQPRSQRIEIRWPSYANASVHAAGFAGWSASDTVVAESTSRCIAHRIGYRACIAAAAADPLQTRRTAFFPDRASPPPRRRWLAKQTTKLARTTKVSRRERSRQNAQVDRPGRERRPVIRAAAVVAALAIVLCPFYGRGMLASWARQQAIRQLDQGAITAAQQRLDWAVWLDPRDGRTDLLQAVCFRRLQEVERFIEALESARQKGAPQWHVEQESTLGQIHAGRMQQRPELQLIRLIEAGRSPHEVAAAFVAGFLVRGESEEAWKVLDAWSADHPQQPDVNYMKGVYWQWMRQEEQAEAELEKALTRQPRHELARRQLAELLEEQDRIEAAYQQYHQWATRFPTNETARAGLARTLRKAGRNDQARGVLHRLAAAPEPSPLIAEEMGQLELESGNYDSALAWFRKLPADQFQHRDLAYDAATGMALAGKPFRAVGLIAQADADLDRRRRIDDLQLLLATAPATHRQAAADEIQRLSDPSADVADIHELLAVDPQPPSTAAEIFAVHCSPCHGATGDGSGPAAASLFPKPLDLRGDRFRLVSTDNGVATREDVARAIRRGIPGTSMPPFEHLGETVVQLLAEETLRLNREGVREQVLASWKELQEDVDEDEVRALVELRTTPGTLVSVPAIGPASADAVARGRETYFKVGCQHCHGDDGSGASQGPMHDPQGALAPPRDLVHDPFKGGQEPAAIYRRLLVGMPGTLHPGSPTLPEDQLIDLVQFVRWLAQEPNRQLTNFQRLERASRRASPAASGLD